MPRVSSYPMMAVPDALRRILELARPLSSERVPFTEAAGRFLAESVRADANLPAAPRSSVDGYAVQSTDTAIVRQVIGEVTAGHVGETPVSVGNTLRIMTGGLLPPGSDAVVMVEEVDEVEGVAHLHHLPKHGENVHPVGMDLQADEVILRMGAFLGISEVGLLAAVGHTRVAVHRRPRVAILATGDEIVEPDQVPPVGAVRDSNRFALMAAVRDAGGEVVWNRHGRDDEAMLAACLDEALSVADVVITSGGVSMGTRDLIKPLIEERGEVHFGRISFKPGKPLTFATTPTGQLLFGLPGFPVSSLVTFEVFVRPALRCLAGCLNPLRPRVTVVLDHEIKPDELRLEYQRASIRWESDRWHARNTGLQASSRLLSIVGANALLEIQPGTMTLPIGSTVPALLLADL